MFPYKSPGPDGMSSVFFQKYWHIVGSEITSFVLEFLHNKRFDGKFNYTYIVLIPKCESPESMSHLRPISLCNISYKIAFKVLANRLKYILKYIVSESQSAFIPGRLITDNVLIAYKLNHYLAHKTWGSVGHAALKLDLSKAYDCVEWSFLVRVLAKLGFHPRFISLIHLCVSTVSYSFLLDEALSHLISTAKVNGSLCSVSVSWHGPRVLHLVFADDTLIFYQATWDAMLCGMALEGVRGDIWTDESRMVHWISWNKLCARKDEGGLGLRRLATFNHAMLAKQLWRITFNPNALLSRLLKQKDFPHSDVFQASAGTGCSFTWRSILAARDLFILGLRWHIGTGQNVCIWKDSWIPRPWKIQVIMAPNTLHPDATVDKLLDDLGGWNGALIRSFFRSEDVGLILGIGRTSIDQALLELFSFVGLFGILASGCSSRTTEFQWRSSSNGFGDWNILSLALVVRLWIWRIPSSRRRRHPLIPMASVEFVQWLSYPCSVALSFRPPSLGDVVPPLALNFLSSAESRNLVSRRVQGPR
ncbi:UNVERIFIED_CONTAM: LINE-1 retrotransposable element O protein [Sesamum angustifolium]|uniref:LINE-1 retrotransposable element O protein n=1 Tax=Sesamum angustifolium TaxID=2727405 RepID=A0AAW2KFV3_9LAMI